MGSDGLGREGRQAGAEFCACVYPEDGGRDVCRCRGQARAGCAGDAVSQGGLSAGSEVMAELPILQSTGVSRALG